MRRRGAEGETRRSRYEQLRCSLGWTGAAGMLGALVFLAGDGLLYFTTSGERDIPTIMGQVPLTRLYVGGALGLVGSWLYTLGAWQVYLAVEQAGLWSARSIFAALAAMMIGTGAFHVAHTGLGLVARTARTANADEITIQLALDQSWGYIALLVEVLTVPTIIFAVLFIVAVWRGRTRYPRWFVLVTPSFVPFLYPAVDRLANATLPSVPYLLVSGSFYDVGFFLFYTVSTVVLWRGAARGGLDGSPV
jgi:hypothetical protein